MNIKDILMCPECRSDLTEDLKCPNSCSEYGFNDGVYDIISSKFSGDGDAGITEEHKVSKQMNNWFDIQRKADALLRQLINTFSGTVCDLATGNGYHLQKLLDAEKRDCAIVCTDIYKDVLVKTRKNRKTDDSKVFYVATDARQMSVKDGSFDYITTDMLWYLCSLKNGGDKVAKEAYRILKPQGYLVSYHNESTYGNEAKRIEKEAEEKFGAHILELKNAGFKKITFNVIAEELKEQNYTEEIKESMLRGILKLSPNRKIAFYNYCKECLYVIQAEKF